MFEKNIDSWIKNEFSSINLPDTRLNVRFLQLMNDFIETPSANIAQTFSGDWSKTKAAYRFVGNKNVDMNLIFEPHISKTRERIAKEKGIVFAIEDTTYINYGHHPKKRDLGKITSAYGHDINGIILHTTLAVSGKGIPLGILDHNIFCRQERNEDVTV